MRRPPPRATRTDTLFPDPTLVRAGVHRLAERFRGRLPVAVMVAIAMRARLALPGDGIELLGHPRAFRSEEHTSELQSLMRNSSAVFCLQTTTCHHLHVPLSDRQHSQLHTPTDDVCHEPIEHQ